MTIVITDSKDELRLTQAEFDRYKEMYDRTYSMYYGKPPSLEEYIRRQRIPIIEQVKLPKDEHTYKLP